MKKIIFFTIGIILTYLFIKFIIHDFFLGHEVNYKIKDSKYSFEVNEVLNLKRKQGFTNYYLKIKKDKKEFNFKVNDYFGKDINIVEKVKYAKKANYECLMPIFKDNKILTDALCYYDGKLYYYNSLKDKIPELKNFSNKKFIDKPKKIASLDSVTLYDNAIEKHYLSIDNYYGIYLINKDGLKNVELYDEDIYETKIKGLVNNYYIVADYNQKHDFNEFLLVDIKNGKKDTFTVNYDINFDSYVNGTYKNSLYLMDLDSKVQYEINVKNKNANIVSNKTNGIIIYNNDKKEYIELSKALSKEYYFKENKVTNKKYDRSDLVSGKYYYYIKDGKYYHVYEALLESKNSLIYLFDTSDLNSINYVDQYIYYRLDNKVLYYNSEIGSRLLFKNSEYEFNDSLKYFVFSEV